MRARRMVATGGGSTLLLVILLVFPVAVAQQPHAQEPRALEAPAELTCTAYKWGVELRWPEVEGAERYKIYRGSGADADENADADSPFTLRHFTTQTTWTDASVEPDVVYRYQVVAIQGAAASPPVECEVGAIPFFPRAAMGTFALVAAVGAYVWARRVQRGG